MSVCSKTWQRRNKQTTSDHNVETKAVVRTEEQMQIQTADWKQTWTLPLAVVIPPYMLERNNQSSDLHDKDHPSKQFPATSATETITQNNPVFPVWQKQPIKTIPCYLCDRNNQSKPFPVTCDRNNQSKQFPVTCVTEQPIKTIPSHLCDRNNQSKQFPVICVTETTKAIPCHMYDQQKQQSKIMSFVIALTLPCEAGWLSGHNRVSNSTGSTHRNSQQQNSSGSTHRNSQQQYRVHTQKQQQYRVHTQSAIVQYRVHTHTNCQQQYRVYTQKQSATVQYRVHPQEQYRVHTQKQQKYRTGSTHRNSQQPYSTGSTHRNGDFLLLEFGPSS